MLTLLSVSVTRPPTLDLTGHQNERSSSCFLLSRRARARDCYSASPPARGLPRYFVTCSIESWRFMYATSLLPAWNRAHGVVFQSSPPVRHGSVASFRRDSGPHSSLPTRLRSRIRRVELGSTCPLCYRFVTAYPRSPTRDQTPPRRSIEETQSRRVLLVCSCPCVLLGPSSRSIFCSARFCPPLTRGYFLEPKGSRS